MISDSGPSRRAVESQATVALAASTAASILDYALVDLNRFVLPLIDDPGPGSLLRTFGAGHGPVPEIKVGIGDTVQVTLFEAQAGGLFIPVDAGSRPGNFVTLPNQTVDAKGYITVPYAGQIPVLKSRNSRHSAGHRREIEGSRDRAAGDRLHRQPDVDAGHGGRRRQHSRQDLRSTQRAIACSTRFLAPGAYAIPATKNSSPCSAAA